MAICAPSLLGLLTALQRQGLTYAMLADFVRASQAKHTGPVLFHLTHGHIRTLEVKDPARERTPLFQD